MNVGPSATRRRLRVPRGILILLGLDGAGVATSVRFSTCSSPEYQAARLEPQVLTLHRLLAPRNVRFEEGYDRPPGDDRERAESERPRRGGHRAERRS